MPASTAGAVARSSVAGAVLRPDGAVVETRCGTVIALALSYGRIALVFTENLNFGGHAHEVAFGAALVLAGVTLVSARRIKC